MAQTERLNLTLTEVDETELSFFDWRQLINGSGVNSNTEKLDAAIAALQDKFAGYADGLIYNAETGALQLSSNGTAIGDSVIIKLSDYYTKAEVDAIIANIPGATVSMDNYYTKAEADAKMNEIAEQVDLSDYYTKAETETYVTDAMGELANNEAITDIKSTAIGTLSYDETTGELTTQNLLGEPIGESFVIMGGGGGGGDAYSVRLSNGMGSNTFTTAYGSKVNLRATYFEYYDGISTGSSGTLTVSYKLSTDEEWTKFSEQVVQNGIEFSIDVGSALQMGKTVNILFSVTGSESDLTRTLTYNITAVEASIEAVQFDPSITYTGDISFQYKCMGRNLKKTVYFIIDGSEHAHVDVGTSHNVTLTQKLQLIGNYSYGAHTLVVYFETEDGARSNELKYTLLYNDGSSTAPMIGVVPVADEITYGDALAFNYVVYTPNQETTDELVIRVYQDIGGAITEYDEKTLSDIKNNEQALWQTNSYPATGVASVEFKSGSTVVIVQVTINEIQTDYDLEPVSTSLIYSYSAAGRSNNDSDRDAYAYQYTTGNGTTTDIKGVFEGFNWVSNGYVDGAALTLSGAAKHTIQLPMFSTSYVDSNGKTINLESASGATVTTNGRTFEIEFTVTNVTDINAPIIKCMSDDHAGFIVTPQSCYLLSSNGADVELDSTGFIENEENIAAAYIKDDSRIRLSFVIEPKGAVQYELNGQQQTGQCVNIYINGQFANSFPYPDNARFAQSEYISMGDSSCILKVYDIRIYNRGLSTFEISQNYKTSPLSVSERITRFEDNDVLDDNGDVDYNKAIDKYNCILFTGALSPYKGAKRYGGITLTKADGAGGHTVEYNLMDKDDSGSYVSYSNVQGTSSVKFPVKNYKFYLAKNNPEGEGTVKVKYSLKGLGSNGEPLSIPESTLCWKGDYMSSDHANTFNANLADTLFSDKLPSQDVAQGGDPRVQNTVYGFRCLLFRRDDVDGEIEFVGDGCLNNDKGNTATFGLNVDGDSGNDTTRQKWEFLNNTETLCSFLTDRFQEPVPTKDGTQWRVLAGLESTYPDQGDLKDAGLTPNYDYIQSLFTWVYQRANFYQASTDTLGSPITYNGVAYNTERDYRKAVFVNEFTRHLNLDHCLVYYLFSEFIALCDNRAKNMFMRCDNVKAEQLRNTSGDDININTVIDTATGEVHADQIDWESSAFAVWAPVLYDLDSCFGVENSGYLQIPYYADWNYTLKGVQKFNGRESLLWLMFEEAFADQIEAKAQELTEITNGGLNYDSLYNYHILNNAKKVCHSVVNCDMERKYNDPWVNGYIDYSTEGNPVIHISSYKYLQRGDRTEQKNAFIYKRCNLLYSKYRCNKFLNNNINFRVGVGTKDDGGILASESGITVTASQALYPAVKYGDGSNAAVVSAGKTAAGTPVTITKPGSTENDKVGFSDTVYIAGGALLTDIGDISKFQPYELQLQNAKGLKKLTIGSNAVGYSNVSLKDVDTSACTILEELNIRNCTGLVGNINLSANGILRKLYASGCGASSVTLPNGGVMEEIELGDITDLEILNHATLTSFSCDSYDRLKYMRVENTPNVPVLDIITARLPYLTNGLRLVGIDATADDPEALFALLLSDAARGKYIDNNGVLSEDASAYPYISGTIHCDKVGSYTLTKLNEIYPYLTIDYTTLVNQYLVTFLNCGEVFDTQYVMHGQSALNPLTRADNPKPTPTKPDTQSTSYTFEKWSGAWKNDDETTTITANTTYEAQYVESIRQYTVTWKYYNGTNTEVSRSVTVDYGSCVEFDGDTPARAAQDSSDYGNYWLFDHWDKSTACVTEDITVNAVFSHADLAEIMANKPALSTMTPVDLYALVQGGKLESTRDGSKFVNNNTYIQCADTIDVVMGRDFDYDNIPSYEIVPLNDPLTFDGTSGSYHIATDEDGNDIMPFKDDESFVLAVDFEFDETAADSGSTRVLMSCFGGNNGFKLQTAKVSGSSVYNGYVYGGTTSTVVSSVAISGARMESSSATPVPDREVLVIRKLKGDNNLYVYSSNRMSDAIREDVLTGAFLSASTDYKEASLAFGALITKSSASSYCKGTIHWSKIWYGDIGEAACRELVSWPREAITLVATGNDRDDLYNLYIDSVESGSSHCCFISQGLLSAVHSFTPTGSVGSWKDSDMRPWVTGRIFAALPKQWQMLVINARLSSACTDGSTVETIDPVWLPSDGELGYDGGTDAALAIFSGNDSRVKISPLTDAAAGYFTRTFVQNSTWQYVRGVDAGGQFVGSFQANSSTYRSVCIGFYI